MDSDQLNICTALPLRRVNNINLFVNALCVILSHCITLLKTFKYVKCHISSEFLVKLYVCVTVFCLSGLFNTTEFKSNASHPVNKDNTVVALQVVNCVKYILT